MDADAPRNRKLSINRRVPEKGNPFSGQIRLVGGYPLPVTSSEAIYLPQIGIQDLALEAGHAFPVRYTEGARNRIDVLVVEEGFLICRDKEFTQKELHRLQARILNRFGAYTVPYDFIRRPDGGEDVVHRLRLIPWHIVPAGLRYQITDETWKTFNEGSDFERYMRDWQVCEVSTFAHDALGVSSVKPSQAKGVALGPEGRAPVPNREAGEKGLFLCDLDRLAVRMESEPSRQGVGGGSGAQTLVKLSFWKTLLQPDRNHIGQLSRLKEKLPNFAAVIEFIRGKLLAQHLSQNPMRLPPILLLGDPGVGKSYYTRKLAEALGMCFESIAVAGSSQELHITGLSKGWGSAGPSRFAEILANSMIANPLILVDEIDKTGHLRVENSLLQVFEPETAARWVDQYVEVPLDLSRAMFIATANDASALSPILLSRFEVFDIAAPDRVQLNAVFASIYEDELGKFGNGELFAPRLPEAIIGKLTHAAMTPRTARRALIDAMERAIVRTHDKQGALLAGSVAVHPDDLVVPRSAQPAVRMGFI